MNRRTFITLCGSVGVTGMAGCSGVLSGGEGGHVSPEEDAKQVPTTLICDADEFERHWRGYEDDVALGDTGEFSLRVNATSFEYGETAEIALQNTTSETENTGNRDKYNLEIRTEEGWRDVRGWSDGEPLPYTDDAVEHAPDEGFEWEIELTEGGILAASTHADALEVCPVLKSGRYRLTYWGLIGDEAVAVEFDFDSEG